MLLTIAETKCMLVAGGLNDQPAWLIDTLSWFLPKYDLMKFRSRIDMIFGKDKKDPKANKNLTPGPKEILRQRKR